MDSKTKEALTKLERMNVAGLISKADYKRLREKIFASEIKRTTTAKTKTKSLKDIGDNLFIQRKNIKKLLISLFIKNGGWV